MEKGIIWDFDGTIADSNTVRNQFFFYMCLKYEKPCPGRAAAQIEGKGLSIPEVYHFLGFSWEEEQDLIWKEFIDYFLQNVPKPFPFVKECMYELKDINVKQAMVSANDRRIISKFIKTEGLGDIFSVVATRENESNRTDMLLNTAAKMNISPVNCIYVDDFGEGMTHAKNAGMKGIAIGYGGFTSPERIRNYVPDKQFVDNPKNLLKTIYSNL